MASIQLKQATMKTLCPIPPKIIMKTNVAEAIPAYTNVGRRSALHAESLRNFLAITSILEIRRTKLARLPARTAATRLILFIWVFPWHRSAET